MVKTKIHIYFVRPREVYRPGEWIEGVVHLEAHNETHARAVRLVVYGRESTTKEIRNVVVDDARLIINTTLTLWGYPNQDKDFKGTKLLSQGSYAFPFRVQLPAVDLPASGKFWFGRVLYRIKAYLHSSSVFKTSVKTEIKVEPRLLSEQSLSNGALIESECGCPFYCCFFPHINYGTVHLRVRSQQPYLVAGRPALFTALIDNQSSVEMSAINMNLVQRMEFRTQTYVQQWHRMCRTAEYTISVAPSKSFSNMDANTTSAEENCASDESQPLKANDSTPFVLQIPATLPAAFNGELIKLWYEVAFNVSAAGKCTQDSPVVTLKHPSAQNPTDCAVARNFMPVEFRGPSQTGLQACFNFDGMDYNFADQFMNDKPVMYPYFHCKEPEVISSSLDEFDARWRAHLAAPIAPIYNGLCEDLL